MDLTWVKYRDTDLLAAFLKGNILDFQAGADADLCSRSGQTAFPGMRVLCSGNERRSVAADSPSRGITLPAPPAHTPWKHKEVQQRGYSISLQGE